MPTIVDIATQFVDLALKYEDWGEIKSLPPEELQTLHVLVAAAGFEPKEVRPGKLVGHCYDQGGSDTGETYPINSLCRFKVVGEDGEDDYFATGWLDCALRRVAGGLMKWCDMREQKESRNDLIEAIVTEIEKSVPLAPIQITPQGDVLCERHPRAHSFDSFNYFVKHTRDDDVFHSAVHKFCDGPMKRMGATGTHDAIICERCHLRTLFPKGVRTFGDLRQAFASEKR